MQPGEITYHASYNDGRIFSTQGKTTTINGKSGESYLLCAYHNFDLYETKSKGNQGDWVLFPVLISGEELEKYNSLLGYNRAYLYILYCKKEPIARKLLN